MRVAIRVDASAEIGSGHLMRCLTLADALRARGASVLFVCRRLPVALHDVLRNRAYEVALLETTDAKEVAQAAQSVIDPMRDARQTSVALEGGRYDWLVVDQYALDARWERALRDVVPRFMVIDDLADRTHDCDVLLDQNLLAGMTERYATRVPEKCELLLGPHYALLQSSYAELRGAVAARESPLGRVLVFFGGGETDGVTARALDACLRVLPDDVGIDVVIATGSRLAKSLAAAAPTRPNLVVHRSLPSLAPLMANASLALGACGTTSWERLCLGLPGIVVTMAENQRAVATELHERGLVCWLGDCEAVSQSRFEGAIRAALDHPDFDAWSRRCLDVCDGQGAARCVQTLLAHSSASTLVASGNTNSPISSFGT
jgi:UDP-2,4-diacetamido-2,4,6-trideoxy-beta-L-altropyranose hydrolase